MKKVFSKEKFRANMKANQFADPDYIERECNNPTSWITECDGLTKEEIKKLGYVTSYVWMVDVEDE